MELCDLTVVDVDQTTNNLNIINMYKKLIEVKTFWDKSKINFSRLLIIQNCCLAF